MFVIGNLSDYHIPRYKSLANLCARNNYSISLIEVYGQSGLYRYPQSRRDEFFNDIQYTKETLFPESIEGEISSFQVVVNLHRALKKIGPTIVITLGYNTAYSVYLALTKRIHDFKIIFMSDSKADDGVRHGWKEKLKWSIVSRFDAALVAGKKHRDYVATLGIPLVRSRTGFDVIDIHAFERSANDVLQNREYHRRRLCLPSRYVLCVSRLIDRKNVTGVLEAFSLSAADAPELHLVLIGEGPLETSLRERAQVLNIADRVIIHNQIMNSEMPAYYVLADYLVLGSEYDQWGICVNEAMASGTPVIVTSTCGCAGEIVIDGVTGYVVPPNDVNGLAGRMRELLENQELRKTFSHAASTCIRKWSPDLFSNNMLELVDAITSTK
jgi:glycosyltransferase involved in cell wall biosynthesis